MRVIASYAPAKMWRTFCACFGLLSMLPVVSFAQPPAQPGSIDTIFNPGTGPNAVVRAVAVEADGQITIAGAFSTFGNSARLAVARLNPVGQLDPSFVPTVITGEVRASARQADGKIVIGGDFSTSSGMRSVARLNANGTLDTTFNPGSGANASVWAIALQADGKVIIGGDFTTVGGTAKSRVARLDINGSIDATFGPQLALDGPVRAMKLLPGGQVLIAGNFTSVSDIRRNRIARLSSSGGLDLTFDPGAGVDSWVMSMAVQPDGRIVIGGSFSSVDSLLRNRIARLNSNGQVDISFDPGLGANANIATVALQPDGKVLAGGGFTSVDGKSRKRVARLYPDGIVDPFFLFDPGASDWVETIAVQPDNRILIGGDFTSVNASARIRVARLIGGDPPPSAPAGGGASSSITTAAGTDVTLQAGVTASPQPSYQWFFNGAEIAGATRDTLRLRNVQTNAAGQYSVTVTNALGSVTRTVAAVTVTAAPTDPGAPDPTFYTGSGPSGDPFSVNAIAVQSDDKVLIGGEFTSVDGLLSGSVARLHPNGAVDPSFRAVTSGSINSLAVRPDGRIFVGGSFREPRSALLLAGQLNSDGTFDTSFQAAVGTGSVSKVLVLPDQRTLIGGAFQLSDANPRVALARLTSNGAVDQSFNVGFLPGAAVFAFALEPNGQVMVGGLFSSVGGLQRRNLVRINPNGAVDQAFNPGTGPNGSVRAMALQPDGKLIIAGRFSRVAGVPRLRVARLNSDGSLDPTFDSSLILEQDDVTSVALQGDGKILIGTRVDTGDFALARLNRDGSLDGSFRTVPFPNRPSYGPSDGVESIAVLSSGKVLIGGHFLKVGDLPRPLIARVLGGDPPPARPVIIASPASRTVASGSDVSLETAVSSVPAATYQWRFNGIDLPGENRWFLALRNVRQANIGLYTVEVRNALGATLSVPATLTVAPAPENPGAPDLEFYAGLGPDDRVEAIAIQPDRKILIAGAFTQVNGIARSRIARLNRNGSLDLTFNPGLGANDTISALALQADGRILVGGSFTSFNGVTRSRLVRLNSNGAVDSTYSANSGADRPVLALLVESNGAALIGGSFTTVNGTSRNALARLNPDGTLDTAFLAPVPTAAFGPNSAVNALALQTNGAILVGGSFVHSSGRTNVVRLTSSGATDATFITGSGPPYPVKAITVETGGKILIGGQFFSYAGVTRPFMARLLSTGGIDGSFVAVPNGPVLAMGVQANSAKLAAGNFTDINNTPAYYFARLTDTGGIDPSFKAGAGAAGGIPVINEYGELLQTTVVSALAIEAQDSVIIGGNFSTVNNTARPHVARVLLRHASLIDSDSDGLPDQWEQQNGLDPYSSAGANGTLGDPDGDAHSNRAEYINGTNPARGDSFEPVIAVTQTAPGVHTLRFPTSRGRIYRILYTPDLKQPFTPVGSQITGTGSEVTWIDDGSQTGGAAQNRFYRLEIQLAPVQ